MDLRTYLFLNRVKATVLANKLEVTSSYVSYLANGKRRPSKEIAKKIVKFTKGAVTYKELLAQENLE